METIDLKVVVIVIDRCFIDVRGCYKKHSIDPVLPSGVDWEASIAKRII